MGDVADFFTDIGRSVAQAAEELARETDALIARNKALAAVVAVINPVSLVATYAATHSGPILQSAYDMGVKPIGDLQWYWFLNPIAPFVGAQQHYQEQTRRDRNRLENNQAEALAEQVAQFHKATAELVAEKATGELRLLQSRIAATYVGPGTYVTDDKPPEWRMYEQLYKVKLLSSEEWQRQRVAATYRVDGIDRIEETFLRSARHFRSRF